MAAEEGGGFAAPNDGSSSALLFRTLTLIPISYLCWAVWAYLTSPLRQYPGPFLAGEYHSPFFFFLPKAPARLVLTSPF